MKAFQQIWKIIWNMIPLPVCLRNFFLKVKELFNISETTYHEKKTNLNNSSKISIKQIFLTTHHICAISHLSNFAFQCGNSWKHNNK